ncbi:MAG: hypothetical protein JSS89_09340 [Bacteroidetes bacterium]|nr:hypothetical protein [Bacteroidota bacterium]
MIARHITFVVLIVSGVFSATAQRAWIVAPQVGATFASASFQQLGPLVLPERATGLSSSTSWMAGMRGAMRLPLFSRFSLVPSVGISYSNAAVVTTEPTTFAIYGNLVPGTFEHTYTFSTMAVEGGMEARYTLFPFLDVAAGVGSFITTSMYGTHDMTITDPAGVTFTDGSSTQRRAEGAIPERNTFVPFATASLIVPVKVSKWNVDVEAGYRTTLTSMVSTATLTTQQVFARIGVRFDLASIDEAESPYETLRMPTTTPVLEPTTTPAPVLPTLRTVPTTDIPPSLPPLAVVAPSRPAPSVLALCNVAFRQSNGRVSERGVVRMERTLMQTIDHGPNDAAISRIDTILRADPPIVLLRPLVSTDDSVARWSLRIVVSDTLLFERDGLGAPPREIEWDCATISRSLFELLIRDSAVVHVDAVGKQGGKAVSAPTTIRLVEGRRMASLDTSRINVTIWGYNVNAVDLPEWARTTIRSLRRAARTATSVSIYGSADGDGERNVNQRIAEQRAQKAATALGQPNARIDIDPIPSAQAVRNERDRRIRIVLRK